MTERNLFIAAYDITDPDRLRQGLEIVKGYATGGQKSAYECFLNLAERKQMLGDMREALDLSDDRFMLIRLDPRSRVHTLGIAAAPADPAYFYFG